MKKKPISLLDLFKNRKKILILDTETTGVQPHLDELLQVSIIDGDGNVLFDRYIRPTRAIMWPDAELVNHISPEMVQNEPTIEELLPQIQSIIQSADCIIGYNVSFDIDFLRWANCDFPEWGGDDPKCLIIDVMELFAPIYGVWNSYYGNYKWQSLRIAADHYGYDWSSIAAHNSLGDCFATLHVWNRMVAKGDVQKAERLILEANTVR
jgi:DNA polymerase-3 subunit epsilon